MQMISHDIEVADCDSDPKDDFDIEDFLPIAQKELVLPKLDLLNQSDHVQNYITNFKASVEKASELIRGVEKKIAQVGFLEKFEMEELIRPETALPEEIHKQFDPYPDHQWDLQIFYRLGWESFGENPANFRIVLFEELWEADDRLGRKKMPLIGTNSRTRLIFSRYLNDLVSEINEHVSRKFFQELQVEEAEKKLP